MRRSSVLQQDDPQDEPKKRNDFFSSSVMERDEHVIWGRSQEEKTKNKEFGETSFRGGEEGVPRERATGWEEGECGSFVSGLLAPCLFAVIWNYRIEYQYGGRIPSGVMGSKERREREYRDMSVVTYSTW